MSTETNSNQTLVSSKDATAAPSNGSLNVPTTEVNAIYLKDYKQPEFWIPKVNLHFNLNEEFTRVKSVLSVEKNLAQQGSSNASLKSSLVLNGEKLKLVNISLDGKKLGPKDYELGASDLIIPNAPDRFTLEIETEIEPQKNLACEGLYKSSGMYCTQCEAESFRKITYFLDRPDVMSVYTVTIEAEKSRYPILLSNGNLSSKKDLPNGRHQAVWHDPFKKPPYLFALVAGDLGSIEDRFVTKSGREVILKIFAKHGNEDRCQHAMQSLKWSMKWDEDTYGLEYDLDIFMIVVAEDFNMGAMENKGLNIFNANYILANPQTATDHDYNAITAVVGHEYFHNFTGNRVTCRDWFQLSLKEGLTVFRDQRFSADLGSAAVHRIDEVIRLRTHQFAEDAGPMAHPVRPQSYITIDNFYTLTVYEKGAEVIRMIETILGRDGFRKGMDLYFKRHDGQAVTTEDFVSAMSDANNIDLNQFKNWYDQAGTPIISVKTAHNVDLGTYEIILSQRSLPSPGQRDKKPFHVPIVIGLLNESGKDLDLGSKILHLREEKQVFTFEGIKEKPVLSLLRGFSAPVRVEYEYTDEELAFLIAHDSDSFSRWEAAQTFVCRLVKDLVADHQSGVALREPTRLIEAYARLLKDTSVDSAFISLMLALPAEQYMSQFFKTVDVEAIFAAREHLMLAIARAHRGWFKNTYAALVRQGTEGFGPQPSGRRSLKNRCLEYLAINGDSEDYDLCLNQQKNSGNMTEELGALEALNRMDCKERETALADFYSKWKKESLVMNKWLTMQAISPLNGTLDTVRRLSLDPIFDKNNPNKIYSLYAAYCRFNQLRFHDPSGEGYRFIADQVLEIDSRNPQVASRLMTGFGQWRIMESGRQDLIKTELSRILTQKNLSNNVYELASKMLHS